MKSPNTGTSFVRPLIIGALLGGLMVWGWISARTALRSRETKAAPSLTNWPPREYYAPSGWCYLKVDTNGWSTGEVGTFHDLDERLAGSNASAREICIPIFPSVYTPKMVDKIYYDAIVESDIKPGDKVLVIGTGSGADAWAANLKSKATIYAVEINPMAVANARATARLGNFELKAATGDVTELNLLADFRDFDFVLWNMPFVWPKARIDALKESVGNNNFYDGDDGHVLKKFLAMLPSLLKKGGQAIVLNGSTARDLIPPPATMVKSNKDCVLFVIPNP